MQIVTTFLLYFYFFFFFIYSLGLIRSKEYSQFVMFVCLSVCRLSSYAHIFVRTITFEQIKLQSWNSHHVSIILIRKILDTFLHVWVTLTPLFKVTGQGRRWTVYSGAISLKELTDCAFNIIYKSVDP